MNSLAVVAGALLMSALSSSSSEAQTYADAVLIHGKIWTENPREPEAQALAIQGKHVAAVGSDEAILKLAGPNTKVVDLKGRRVIPGFNDAHVHFYMGGDGLTSVQLHEAGSPEEFRQLIANFAHERKKGEWILNGNWDHERWTPPQLPTHDLVDDVTPDNPVFVNRSDGHMCL